MKAAVGPRHQFVLESLIVVIKEVWGVHLKDFLHNTVSVVFFSERIYNPKCIKVYSTLKIKSQKDCQCKSSRMWWTP